MSVYGAFEPGSFNAWALNLFADVFVTPGVARGMQVTAPGGMQVSVTLDSTANDGVCWLPNGGFLRIDTVQTFPVPNNSSGGTRTDAVVAFVDPTGIANPSFSLTYVTNWSSGFAPANNNQLVLALVSVPNGAVAISTGNITNNSNPATVVGTAGGSNSMVAPDGVGLTVQDNTSSATLTVALTGLTNGAGRSIAIQTTDVSAIGHQATFGQNGGLTLASGNLNLSSGEVVAISPASTGDAFFMKNHNDNTYGTILGIGDPTYGAGAGMYAYDTKGAGYIFYAATKNGITLSGNVVAVQGVYSQGRLFAGGASGDLFVTPQQSGGAGQTILQAWDGTAVHNGLSVQGNGVVQLGTSRNGSPQLATVFTGTTTPVNPPTGSIWVKA